MTIVVDIPGLGVRGDVMRGAILEVLVDAHRELTAREIAAELRAGDFLGPAQDGNAIATHLRDLRIAQFIAGGRRPSSSTRRRGWWATLKGASHVARARRVPSNHARVTCRSCGALCTTVQRYGVGPAYFPACECGDPLPGESHA